MFVNGLYKISKDMRQEITEIVNKTMLSRKRKDELIESLLILYNVRQRSELLLFADYSESDKTSQATDECVDNYLDQKQ